MAFAKQMGYRVKLIAYAKLVNDGKSIQLCVGPMLIKAGKPLAEVRANYNAVSVVGDAVGPAQGISIASVIQHEVSDCPNKTVPLVIMTHQAKESAAVAAMDQIAKMDAVSDDLERLRILD